LAWSRIVGGATSSARGHAKTHISVNLPLDEIKSVAGTAPFAKAGFKLLQPARLKKPAGADERRYRAAFGTLAVSAFVCRTLVGVHAGGKHMQVRLRKMALRGS
jgi:hypothetical protein